MAQSGSIGIARDLYSAYDRADLDAFYKDLSPTILWRESDGFPTTGLFRSKEEIVDNVFKVLGQEWSIFRFSLEYLIDGERARGRSRDLSRNSSQNWATL